MTPAKKIFLGHLIRLCSGPFGKEHYNSINLSNRQIADWCGNAFSLRQIQRHLDDLAAAGFIEIRHEGKTRWICAHAAANAKSVPLVAAAPGLSHAQNLLLSVLLNKAAFRARAGLEFTTDRLNLERLAADLYPICGRTIRNALNKLCEQGFISAVYGSSSKELLSTAFSPALEKSYCELIKLKRSRVCEQYVYRRAVNKVMSFADPSLAAKADEERERRRRRKAGMAEQPHLAAQTVNEAQTAEQQAALWQQAVGAALGTACPPSQPYLKLTQGQVNKLLTSVSHSGAGLSEKKDASTPDCGKQKTPAPPIVGNKRHFPQAQSAWECGFQPPINNKELTNTEINTRADAAGIEDQRAEFTNYLRVIKETLL